MHKFRAIYFPIYFAYESSLECQDQGLPPLDLGDLINLELIKNLGKVPK